MCPEHAGAGIGLQQTRTTNELETTLWQDEICSAKRPIQEHRKKSGYRPFLKNRNKFSEDRLDSADEVRC